MNKYRDYVNYKCEKCNKSFRCQKTAYKFHMLSYHSTFEERKAGFPHFCELCDVGMFNINEFDKHLKTNKHKNKYNIDKRAKKETKK